MERKAISLLSGGLDSSVALRMAQLSGVDVVRALTFDYGQRSAKREQKYAAAISEKFRIAHQILELPFFSDLANAGALLGKQSLPLPRVEHLDDPSESQQSAKAVWVPNRNGIFIEVAAAIAEDVGAESILVGFNVEEAATFPDNSESYLKAVSHSLSFSTANHVKVISPTAPLTKDQIVQKGIEIDFPFSLLWSCYEGGEKMCGRCESCQRLKRALCKNGVPQNDLFTDLH